jgi:AmmeMemoRadiSam system protein A
MSQAYLLEIAKEVIEGEFSNKEINTTLLLTEHPELKEPAAVFVTLRLKNELRGCIGSLKAHQSLLDDLRKNAKAAAFEDPRFLPLTEKEFEELEIEVAVLTTPKELPYKDARDLKSKIIPNRDGVILKMGAKQATFLPQVWEQLPSFELFFEHLCKKAGIDRENCLAKHPTILVYQAEKIK